MTDFDHDRVSALLNIVAKCAGHSGKLSSISNAAMAELIEANDQIKQKALAQKAKVDADEATKKAEPTEVVEKEHVEEIGPNMVRPSVFPADSQTATIADRRI